MSITADLIRILRCFVQGTRPQLSGDAAFAQLCAAAYSQDLLPVLAYMARRWELFGEAGSAALHTLLLQTVCTSTVRTAAFEELSAALSRAGIPHLPVKGWYLRTLYPEPDLRTFGDIDVLIRPEDRGAVHRLMQEKGYTVHTDWEPTYSYEKREEYYEFHTELMDANLDGRSDLRSYFAAAWEHASPAEDLRYAPEADFHFLYILCHLAKHLYGRGAGLRMYLDTALFIRSYNDVLPWDHLRAEMEKLGLGTFYDLLLTTAEQWFGVRAQTDFTRADADTLEALAEYTLQGGVFGFGHDAAVSEVRKDGQSLLKKAFPPRCDLVRRYTYLEKHGFLLPVAWVDRVIRNAGSVGDRLRRLKERSGASAAAIEAHDAFMKKLGL